MLVLGGQVLHQRTAHGIHRRGGQLFAFQPGIQAAGRQQAAGSAFHIALKAGDLARKEHIGVLFQAQLGAEHPGRIEEGVAVHDAIPHELSVLKARDHAEHPLLLAPLEVGLEAHDVVQGAFLIFGPQLDIGPWTVSGVGIHKAHRAQGTEPHGVGTPGGHDLDGHTALIHGDGIGLFAVGIRVGLSRLLGPGVKVVQRCALCRSESRVEFLVLFLVERAVQVVGLAPVIAGGGKHLVVVQTFSGDDGGHGIVEVQPLVPGQGPDLIGQCAVGQWAGGHQNGGRCIDMLHLLPVDSDIFTAFHHAGHFGAECVAVHRQRTASGHAGRLGGVEQLAAHPAHFFLQQAGSRVQPFRF